MVPADGQVTSQSRSVLALALLAPWADAGDPLPSCLRRCAPSAQKMRGADSLALSHAPDRARRATSRLLALANPAARNAGACARDPAACARGWPLRQECQRCLGNPLPAAP